MRLIDVRTKEIRQFYGGDTPPYAILSHTWGNEEISYQDWTCDLSPNLAAKSGYRKIVGACLQAEQDNLDYLWVDTNCIDKTSSAELSEAINSMFMWYENAVVCYAYLDDVGDEILPGSRFRTTHRRARSTEPGLDPPIAELSASRWFTRGWTLQELLAPPKVIFFDCSWKDIGTRQELRFEISTITGIDVTYLGQRHKIFSASSAARLSWAAKRQTTRVEDMAYCLMGLFDIHMPLIYGEGPKAFLRLQEEIIRSSDDQTIFCWTWEADLVPHGWCSILAPSPAVFDSGLFVPAATTSSATPYQITNVGLRIKLPVVTAVHCVCAVLDVISSDDTDPEKRRRMCLPLLVEDHVYRRVALPGRSFPVHLAMVSEVRDLFILSRMPRDLGGLSILPYRPRFAVGFQITMMISGSHGSEHPLGVDCLVPQYPQSPFSHTSMPVYSVVGFRGPLKNESNILILRVRYKDDTIPILLFVGTRTGKPIWHCEILQPRFLAYSVEEWLSEVKKLDQRSQPEPSSPFHRLGNVVVALDRETCDAAGRYFRSIYITIRDEIVDDRVLEVQEELVSVFGSQERDRIYATISQTDTEI